MDKAEAKAQITILSMELKNASDSYYQEGVSRMSDQLFDGKLRELAALEEDHPEFADPHSPTKRVGSDLSSRFEKVTHVVPMISIDNIHTYEEFLAFTNSVENELGVTPEYTAEFKLDGLSLGVEYDAAGNLVRAVTRGDGAVGDDVTKNARTIADIPLIIKNDTGGTIEVRGEVILGKKQFEAINAANAKTKETIYQNTRNAAAGILKSSDPREVARKRLQFFAFGIARGTDTKNQQEEIAAMKAMGFPNVNGAFALDKTNFDSSMGKIGNARHILPFDIDGVVIKVTDKALRERLGRTSKHVKWAKAFKFEAEQARTPAHSVTWQVGRTGRITPVAELDPVFLCGTTVRRATLHNCDEIERLDLHLGDEVYIEKGGEIIPKVIGVDTSARDEDAIKVVPISKCPCCGTTVERGDDVDLYCTNELCPDRLQKAMDYVVSRKVMNVMNVGPSLLAKLIKLGILQKPLDIFRLTPLDFEDVEGMGASSVGRALDGIDAAKRSGADRVLASMCIRHVGAGTSGRILAVYNDFEVLAETPMKDIAKIRDVGEVAAKNVVKFFKENPGIIQELKDLGLSTKAAEVVKGGVLFGHTVVFTGGLETMDREEAQDLVKSLGGKTTGSVSKKTTIVVYGEGAGSKLDKAREYGTLLLTESQFVEVAHGRVAIESFNR